MHVLALKLPSALLLYKVIFPAIVHLCQVPSLIHAWCPCLLQATQGSLHWSLFEGPVQHTAGWPTGAGEGERCHLGPHTARESATGRTAASHTASACTGQRGADQSLSVWEGDEGGQHEVSGHFCGVWLMGSAWTNSGNCYGNWAIACSIYDVRVWYMNCVASLLTGLRIWWIIDQLCDSAN